MEISIKSSAAVSGTATVKFYAQASLYDDWLEYNWDINHNPKLLPGSAHARLQILGELNASDNWADANALSCGGNGLYYIKPH